VGGWGWRWVRAGRERGGEDDRKEGGNAQVRVWKESQYYAARAHRITLHSQAHLVAGSHHRAVARTHAADGVVRPQVCSVNGVNCGAHLVGEDAVPDHLARAAEAVWEEGEEEEGMKGIKGMRGRVGGRGDEIS
jgi:hypothetical protein